MRYDNAINSPGSNEPEYYPLTYTHPDGRESSFELQQVRYEDGRTPAYVVSESPSNQGPGFEDSATFYAVSNQAAESALLLNKPELFPDAEREIRPHEIKLYQQNTEGSFERVEFREIGRDARPSTDLEMEQNNPELYSSLKEAGQSGSRGEQDLTPPFTEIKRTPYTRQEVESAVEAPLQARLETPQQQHAKSYEEQWRDLSGPSIDRAAEVTADRRSQEQTQQSTDHQQQQHEQRHEF